jgi:hypothetical protein
VEQCPMVLFVSVKFGGNKPVLPVEVRQEGANGYDQGKFRTITEDQTEGETEEGVSGQIHFQSHENRFSASCISFFGAFDENNKKLFCSYIHEFNRKC